MNRSASIAPRIISCFILAAMAFLFAADALALSSDIVTVVNVNSPPVAQNLAIETYRGVPVMNSFRSVDPEGDTVTYTVSKAPRKGTVDIDGDIFTYSPLEGKKGKDTFSYVAVDAVGNVSDEAVVTVSIVKQSTKVTYADMSGDPSLYDATVLAEKGIFTGEQIGSCYYFSPDESVTRGEFLVMCMELCGIDAASGITRTGFYDDSSIPVWQKPYVSAAHLADFINGHEDEKGRIVFSSNSEITAAEAAVILNNVLDVTNVSTVSFTDSACPVWASQAVMNLNSCGVSSSVEYTQYLTRRDAAELLSEAVTIVEGRK